MRLAVQSNLVSFDPMTATTEEWSRLHAYRARRHEERDPDDPYVEDAVIEAMMRQPDPDSEVLRFAALDPEQPEVQIGMLTFDVSRPESPSYRGNEHIAWVSLGVLTPCRRRGVGRIMLRKAAELALESRKTTIQGYAEEDDGKAFLRAIGAQVGIRGVENRLSLDRVDWRMVESWVAEGAARNPDTSLLWFVNRIEDDLLPAFAKAITEVFNQQPFGDLEHGSFVFTPDTIRGNEGRFTTLGGTALTVVSREKDGDISALTQMGYMPSEAPIIRQWMTGVRDPYRGRGLGKWLKASMLLRVRKDLPQARIVSTGNATTNAAMLSINERLGFRVHKERVGAQIKLEALEAYLRARRT